jgi:hypothetical protein
MKQYQEEERSLIARRYMSEKTRVDQLFATIKGSPVEPREKVQQLRQELGDFHHSRAFQDCESMGELLELHLHSSLARHLV